MPMMDLTAASFEETVSGHEIVFVDFWAGWCRPCEAFAPIYEQAAQANPDLVFASIDTETEQALAAAARVTSIPTLMAFKGGQLVFHQTGALPAADLARVIETVRRLDLAAAPRRRDPDGRP